MPNVVVVGAQWGDEGKGRVVDWLAAQADLVARYNGGHNAGHTLVVGEKTYKLALLPSGIVRGKRGVIGNGVALDPEALLAEIARMAELGVSVTPDNLSIAENATLVLPIHRAIDGAQERLRREPIGTTLRGIGPAYEDKVGRRALRVADLAEPDRLADKLDVLVDHHNAWFRGLGLAPSSRDAMLATLVELAPKILPFVRPVWAELNDAHARGERILFEGSQAVMLDIDWGTYPFVTSSGTIASTAAAGTGLGASKLGHVLGVTKAYATRVGGGPFLTELGDATGERLRARGREFGVNTGRPRRCGWLDAAQLRQAVCVSGIDSLALTKLDVLDGFESIALCVGYELDGARIAHLPTSLDAQLRVRPIYEEFAGWDGTVKGVRERTALPHAAQAFIERVEEVAGAPVSMITTGAERDDTIVLSNPFDFERA
ncbi:adenylosuccinate synthase [Burkholderia vietnamiensis]|uniref:adenylosuccinate synthase n=1 Tax=Burkholderia vietnamiensis TaxID=60552 RepID=UPI001594CBC5|nr:adenylosuccinate synthase [Burkholderia vietnamiensis]MCA7944613.1 adenylosuccinate synthase [Burkholderia vietnamiensis]HDR8970800.1 adenylosuccinate synthase [Burkholderia vietnamiensis]HDR9144960.1 adenylosuccinate synthase [Burkholderia vietnamiensis]HDR9222710.1 adenylosuccinate synthase [Burkholderia vietnamiensis]